MRKSKEEAAETRKRIVTAAAGEFREHGIVATGLADLMKAAGLTHGGFYKHFESKDQVVAEACAEAVRVLMEKLEAAPSKGSALGSYLSIRHRDDPATGCPLAALGSELARSDEKTREAATEGFLKTCQRPRGEVRQGPARGRAAAGPGGGLDDDRRGDDVACGDRRGAVGGDSQGGGEELNGQVIVRGVRRPLPACGQPRRRAVRKRRQGSRRNMPHRPYPDTASSFHQKTH